MNSISSEKGIRGCVESLIGGRGENQDSYGIAETRLGLLVVVCDGMGGGPSGKTASSLATQALIDYVSGADTDKKPESVLSSAVNAANEALIKATVDHPELKGMGTTCVCLLVDDRKAYVAHVGDSRLYQLRNGNVVFRTQDHSYVAEMVRRGTITEEEARNSKYSNVITRAVGVDVAVDCDTDVLEYRPGDRFALMTDGIWGVLAQSQLVKFLSADEDPATLVPRIAGNIDVLGKDNGGHHDNLTLAIIDIPRGAPSVQKPKQASTVEGARTASPEKMVKTEKAEEQEKEAPKERKKPTLLYTILLIVFVLAVIVGVTALLWNRNDPKEEIAKTLIEQTQVNQKTETRVVGTAEFAEAARLLDEIQNLKPGSLQRSQVTEQKYRLFAAVQGKIKEGEEKTNDPVVKDKAKAISENIVNDRRFIVQIDKNLNTTAEAIKYITDYKNRLSDLK